MAVNLLYGAIRLPWWAYVALTFAMVQLMFLGVTLYLHRDQSHGGLVLHPVLRHLFRFWLWFCSGTVTREWVAVLPCSAGRSTWDGYSSACCLRCGSLASVVLLRGQTSCAPAAS